MSKSSNMPKTAIKQAKAVQRRRKLAFKLRQMRASKARIAQICALVQHKPDQDQGCRLEISSRKEKLEGEKGDDYQAIVESCFSKNTETNSTMSHGERIDPDLPSFSYDEDMDMPLMFHEAQADDCRSLDGIDEGRKNCNSSEMTSKSDSKMRTAESQREGLKSLYGFQLNPVQYIRSRTAHRL